MNREVKAGYLYYLKTGDIICINQVNKMNMLLNDSNNSSTYLSYAIYTENDLSTNINRNECILLQNVKVNGKLLYLHSKDLSFLNIDQISEPLIINGSHIRINSNILEKREELTQEYNDNLLKKMLTDEEENYTIQWKLFKKKKKL